MMVRVPALLGNGFAGEGVIGGEGVVEFPDYLRVQNIQIFEYGFESI